MRNILILSLCCLSICVQGAERKKETQLVNGSNIPLTTRQEITFDGVREDADVKTRELWFRRLSDKSWGAWEKHPNDFGPQTNITWAPAEGHWQVYVRIVEISGNSSPKPTADKQPDKVIEFIVDRSSPTVKILTPANGAILRTKQAVTITWEANDLQLHSSPIDLYWSASGTSEEVLIAQDLPNTGSYAWTTPSTLSNEARVIIKATDKVLNTSSNQNSNIIIDGAAPQRSILGPLTSMSKELVLDTRAFDVGPAKTVADMQLWFSSDNGVNWVQGPSSTGPDFNKLAWTAPADGSYLLTLVTSDIAGNKNTIPTSRHDSIASILVDTVTPAIQLANAVGVQVPGAAGENSRRTFKPDDVVSISYTIQDMKLAEKPVSVYFRNAPDAPWELIKNELAADSIVSYKLPNVNSRQCRIKVEAIDQCGNVGTVISDENFTIDNKVEETDISIDLD